MFLDLAEMDCSTINLAQAFLPNRVEIFLIFFCNKKDSGCGAIDRACVSNTRRHRFESNHLKFLPIGHLFYFIKKSRAKYKRCHKQILEQHNYAILYMKHDTTNQSALFQHR